MAHQTTKNALKAERRQLRPTLRENVFDYFAENVGKPEITARVPVSQPGVVNSELVQKLLRADREWKRDSRRL